MIKVIRRRPSCIELQASGQLTEDDFQRIIPLLEEHHAGAPETNYLLMLDGFEGVAPAAFWEDPQFTGKHGDDFARSAVVGDESWKEKAERFAKAFLPGEVRFFPSHQLISARAWVSEGRHAGASKVE